MSKSENFHLSVELLTPVLLPEMGYMTLDALLSYAFEMLYLRRPDVHEVPLESIDGVRCASAAIFTNVQHLPARIMYGGLNPRDLQELPELTNWNRRAYRGHQFVINQYSGDFLKTNGRMRVLTADSVHWFGRGDVEQVEYLMSMLPGVGRKASVGNGAFDHSTLSIDVLDTDQSWVFKDKPARPLPIELWQKVSSNRDVSEEFVAYTYPYFETAKAQCAVPQSLFVTTI